MGYRSDRAGEAGATGTAGEAGAAGAAREGLWLRAGDAVVDPPRLRFDTRALPEDAARDLLALLEGRRDVVSWVRHGRGTVGWGRVLTLKADGGNRIEALRSAWRAVVGAAWWTDPLVRPGTGPVAFGTIAFSPHSTTPSVLVVPEVIVGRDDAGAWITTASPTPAPPTTPTAEIGRNPRRDRSILAPRSVGTDAAAAHTGASTGTDDAARAPRATVLPGALSEAAYLDAVATVQERMAAGAARKVVLARDVLVAPSAPLPVADVLARLGRDYPSCWTFAVDGMIGATPELLVRLEGRRLTSRVLAGTARRSSRGPGGGEFDDAYDADDAARAGETDALAAWLEASPKNNREHELARASALAALEPLCSVVEAPERFVVSLPNVLHLASDISGVVAGDTGALALVGALHPTAAVCGTPTPDAARLIEEVEGMDRGRYAGPVGWVDWHGEGEWCIALRSAEVPGAGLGPHNPARVFGGGGIMPDSDPADELAETVAKMRPVLGALGALDAPPAPGPTPGKS